MRPDELELAINTGNYDIYGALNARADSEAPADNKNALLDYPLFQKNNALLIELGMDSQPFIATILLAIAVDPKNFRELVMPLMLNVSTGSGALLKLNELLEANNYPHLSAEIVKQIARAAYITLIGGLLVMEFGAMQEFFNSRTLINTIGLLAVTGFAVFSGLKLPNTIRSAKHNFILESGLHGSSWGFLTKNILAGAEAKKHDNTLLWTAALLLMYASVLFIIPTGYGIGKNGLAWKAARSESANTDAALASETPHVALSMFSEANNASETVDHAAVQLPASNTMVQ